jgi:hypothetical protein
LSKPEQRTCLPRASRIGATVRDCLMHAAAKLPVRNIQYITKWGCLKARVVQRPTLLTVPWRFLFPPRPPKKNIHVLPKNVSPSDFPSPVCRPKDRFPGQSPSGIQVHRTPAQGFTPKTRKRPRTDAVKSTHLKPSCHRTGTTTVPRPKLEHDPRYQSIPLLAHQEPHPSKQAGATPLACGNLLSNIFPKSHSFFSS